MSSIAKVPKQLLLVLSLSACGMAEVEPEPEESIRDLTGYYLMLGINHTGASNPDVPGNPSHGLGGSLAFVQESVVDDDNGEVHHTGRFFVRVRECTSFFDFIHWAEGTYSQARDSVRLIRTDGLMLPHGTTIYGYDDIPEDSIFRLNARTPSYSHASGWRFNRTVVRESDMQPGSAPGCMQQDREDPLAPGWQGAATVWTKR